MLKYKKEINFLTIIDFKRQQNPSNSCFRAAKCLCLLISSFSGAASSDNDKFNTWTELRNYILANSHKFIQDINSIKAKCEAKEYDYDKIKKIYNDIFLMMDE